MLDYLLMVLVPGLVLGGAATLITKTTFKKYAKVGASSGTSGAEAARQLLDSQGLQNVGIEAVGGFLSDHYDPRHRVLRLSPDVYQGQSLSAIGVACHEAGHAMQHAEKYIPLVFRSTLVPVTNISTKAAYGLIIVGAIMNFPSLYMLGAILFGMAVVFTLVTLPVEWDASARAKRYMVSSGIVTAGAEEAGAAKVLNAAFLTYVAAFVTSLLTFLYYLQRAGLLGRR